MRLGRKIAVNASALAIGRLVNAAMGVVAIGITSRYLGIDAYGALATGLAFVGIASSLTDFGISSIGARELAKRPAERERLLNTLFTLGLVASVAAIAIAVGIMSILYSSSSRELERQAIVLLLLLPPPPIGAVAATAGAYFISEQKGYIGAIASLAGSVLNIVVLVVVVALDGGFEAVVVAYSCQAIGFGLGMLLFCRGEIRMRLAFDPSLMKQIVRWAVPLGGTFIIGSLYYRIDLVLLSVIGTTGSVGIYGLAYRFVDTLMVLPSYVMVTLLPEFARLTENRERSDELMQKASTVMQVSVAPLVVFFVAFAGKITDVVGGSSFDGSARVLQLLMIGVGVAYINSVFAESLIAHNRQAWLFVLSTILLVANVGLNVALIPVLGARGAAIAFALSEIAAFGIVIAMYRRVGRVPRPYRAARVLAAAGAMSAVTLLQHLPFLRGASSALVVAVVGSASAGAYLAALYALRAMPRELHAGLILPLWTWLRPGATPAGS